MRPRLLGLLSAVFVLTASTGVVLVGTGARREDPSKTEAGVRLTLERLPLTFIENRGQVRDDIDYYLQGTDASVGFSSEGVLLSLADGAGTTQRSLLGLEFIGAEGAEPVGLAEAPGVVSYFRGDREDWITGVPTYSRVAYRDLWPGIDLVYSGTGSRLKYSFLVEPGADPSDIRLAVRGASGLHVNARGQLEIRTAGELLDETPFSYQVMGGRRVEVSSAYAVAGDRYGFHVGAYDRTMPLVIDPAMLVYAGYVGGSTFDAGSGIAVDSTGAAYVAGSTDSTEATFPDGDGFGTVTGPDPTFNSGAGQGPDAFVAKLSPSGTSLSYAGYIGGVSAEFGNGIAVDSTGAAYLTGSTQSTEATFPEAGGPDLTFNSAFAGGLSDAFVAKVTPSGTSLSYAGFIGGSGTDSGNGIAVDSAGAAYVVGQTTSTETTFPDGDGFGTVSGPDTTFNGGTDAFVAKVAASGASLDYSGYVGGADNDVGTGIGVDSTGAASLTGRTASTETTFPDGDGFGAVPGPDRVYNGNTDAFVTRVAAAGTSLTYAGYIGGGGNGGSGFDRGDGIAVGSDGSAYVTGDTSSTQATFPDGDGGTTGPDATHNGGGFDAFVAQVSSTGFLVYAGYIGGSSSDVGNGIAVDSTGAAYVTGVALSTQATFPDGDGTPTGPDTTHNGDSDAFVAKVVPFGASLTYAGYIGGSISEFGNSIAVDSTGAVYVTGQTTSTESTFPDGDGFGSVSGPDTTFNGGSSEAFVAKVPVMKLLTLTRAGSGSGTVTSSPAGIGCGTDCTEAYEAGAEVTLTATPGANSTFAGWSGGGCSGTGTCMVTMDADKSVTASFDLAQRTLTVSKAGSGSGTVTSSPSGVNCGVDCDHSYPHGTVVTLAATPGANSTFAGWSGGGCSGTGTCMVTTDADKTVTATFDPVQRTLFVVDAGTGSGTVTSSPSGIDCGSDCAEAYDDGTVVTLTAAPAANSTFAGWSGAGCSGTGTCIVTMDADKAVAATFSPWGSPPPTSPKSVTLAAKPKKVEQGRKAKLTAAVAPCAGHEGDVVDFYRGSKKIATKASDASCTARVAVRMKKTAKFTAVSPQQDADHLAGTSNTVKVRVV